VRGGHASEYKEVEENVPGRIASEWWTWRLSTPSKRNTLHILAVLRY
jgi:hypothetical protein